MVVPFMFAYGGNSLDRHTKKTHCLVSNLQRPSTSTVMICPAGSR
jgi:hypothetical protein